MNDANGVLWRRLRYFLTPQLDLYKHIGDKISGDVLEVGFGTGFGVLQYAFGVNAVTAIELTQDAVDAASELMPLLNVIWGVGDITKKAYPHHDVALMIEVLEHIPNYKAALHNLADSLYDGGTAYISGPNKNATLRKNDKHEREWTAAEFTKTLKEYFSEVTLYDYSLTQVQGEDSYITPLLAVCVK